MKIADRLVVASLAALALGTLPQLEGEAVVPAPSVAADDDEFRLVPSSREPSLRVADDLEVDLVLENPLIAKPLYLAFDERGRLWVVEYRQYPWPAGLKLISRDSVWRNAYDPPFAPPPPHAADSPFRGADRVSIHEDVDGDGTFERSKVFLDGLNMATAALPGRGGVFVLNPPYLLFYADRDRDDVPDEPAPQILLSGFGFEDSHSLANSLRWGPDGWIYATQGSTVSSAVVVHGEDSQPMSDRPAVHSMGQHVWRYHPERRVYEIYAEGGGNAFGIEIDAAGRVYSGHNGGDTRGFHYIQGGYFQKNFAKHGQLSNPYAFDYLPMMAGSAAQRFTHTFTIYEADALPPRYRGVMLAINPIGHEVVVSAITPHGSTRQTRDVGYAVQPGSGERAAWFTPVDVQLGPDGALYVADWYAEQANHYYNHEGKTNPDLGRVFRLRGKQYAPAPKFDLNSESSRAVVENYLAHPNRWFRQQALRVLADRRDASVIPLLNEWIDRRTGQDALEAFWALHLSGGLTEDRLRACLSHANADVRRWCVHLLGDDAAAAPRLRDALLDMAREEPDVEVRSQLAATAARLPANVGVPLAFALLNRAEDAHDVALPKFLWWALEAHAGATELIADHLRDPSVWHSPFQVAGRTVPQNLVRRFALAGTQADLALCAELLRLAPDAEQHEHLVAALADAFAGRPLPALPDELAAELAKSRGPYAQLMAIRRQDAAAIAAALASLADADNAVDIRVATISALGDVRADAAQAIPTFVALLDGSEDAAIQNAALSALQMYADSQVAAHILAAWPTLSGESQAVAIGVLASRREWALALAAAVERGAIPATAVEPDVAGRLRRYGDGVFAQLFPPTSATLSEREARIEALTELVRQGQGSPLAGQELFHGAPACGKCHRMFDRGGDIGPDLTSYNRADLGRMLLALVHPSAEIREGYEVHTVLTADGRMLSGLKVEDTERLLVLRGADGQTQTIPKDEVDDVFPNEQSLMPEGLVDALTDDEIRNLFAFLLSTTPPM